MLRGALLTVFLCAALALAGCGGDDSSTAADTGASAESTEARPVVKVPDGEPPTELVSEELVEGDGAEAKDGDEVTVRYVGVGYESEEEFDASWDRGEPFSFRLGAGEVISGWDQGVAGMKVGARRELIIPPQLAYGPEGRPPAIGPNETLIFVVDLVSVG